jgi:hypothetical protein
MDMFAQSPGLVRIVPGYISHCEVIVNAYPEQALPQGPPGLEPGLTYLCLPARLIIDFILKPVFSLTPGDQGAGLPIHAGGSQFFYQGRCGPG